MISPLPRPFYSRDVLIVARDLLGKHIVRGINGNLLSAKIVEVEAYRGSDDPASHAYRGKTARNGAMFGDVGHSYVYFTYGNHHCLNVVAKVGDAGAVLIRAVEPLRGIDVMMANRGVADIDNLTNGPGKLTRAMAITREQNSLDLTKRGELFISDSGDEAHSIAVSRRIGLSSATEREWRFYIATSRFVSRKRP